MVSLIDCLSEKPTYGANSAALEYNPELPRYVRITDILADGRLSNHDLRSLSWDAAQGNILEPGDIIIARSGASVGKSYLHSNGRNFAYAGYLIRFRPDCSMVLPDYVHAVIQSTLFRRWLSGMRREGAQPNVNAKEYGSFRFPLPPLSEQRRIAAVLRTWDEAIEKLRALINLEAQNLAALNAALVFGSKRLQRFRAAGESHTRRRWFCLPVSWKCLRIEDLAREVSERNSDGAQLEVLSCSKHDGFVRSLSYFSKRIFSSDITGYKKIRYGDFGYPSNHVEEGSIGLQQLYPIGLVSQIYTVFRFHPAKIHNDFAYAVLKTSLYRHIYRVNTSASVSRRGSLRWREFSKLPFPLPPMIEQKAIATTLQAQGRKLRLLNANREALIRQKRRLIEVLLSRAWD